MQDDLTTQVAGHFYGIIHAVHLGQQVVFGYQGWMDARLHGSVRLRRRNGQGFYSVAELGGVAEILGCEAADALGVDRLVRYGLVKRQTSQYREFVRGVDAFDIVGGVGLGVSPVLGFGQRFFERGLAARHPG